MSINKMIEKLKGGRMAKKIIKNHITLLYMTSKEIKAKELSQILKKREKLVVELWEDMNVLEVELLNKNTVDFEAVRTDFKDPLDLEFVKSRNVHTIFAVTLCEEDLEEIKLYFYDIVGAYGGFICADSDDFKPFYVEKNEEMN
jgi:hypothetical protein